MPEYRRQNECVDEPRPVIHAAVAAAGFVPGAIGLNSPVGVLAHEDLQELLDLALLRGPRIRPSRGSSAVQPRMVHEALDGLGEIQP